MQILRYALFVAVALAFSMSAFAAPQGKSTRHRSAQDQTTVSGTVSTKDGKYFITDESTNATAEIRGAGLQKYVGTKVQVRGLVLAGETPAVGATLVVAVSEVSRAGAVAAGVGGKAAAAGVKAGLSKAAIVGIAAGTTGGTVGGLYAADVIGEEETPASRP